MNVQGTQGSPPTEQPAVVMSSHKAAEDSRGCRHLAAFCRHGMNVDTESRNVRAGKGPQRSLNPTLFVRKLRSKGEVTRSVLIQRRAHTHTTHSLTHMLTHCWPSVLSKFSQGDSLVRRRGSSSLYICILSYFFPASSKSD